MDALRNRLESSGAYPLYKLQLLEGLMPYLKTVAVRKNTLWSKNTGAWLKGPTRASLLYLHFIVHDDEKRPNQRHLPLVAHIPSRNT